MTAKSEVVVAGIDYSLSCPAIFISGKDGDLFNDGTCYFRTGTKKYAETFKIGGFKIVGQRLPKYNCEELRYDQLAGWACGILERHRVREVYLEDYSYGSKGKVFHIAENTGILKHMIWENTIDDYNGDYKNKMYGMKVNLVAPTAVKKFATGMGNADKWKMHEAFEKETGINIHNEISPEKATATSPVSDIVDAFWILRYGENNVLSRNESK